VKESSMGFLKSTNSSYIFLPRYKTLVELELSLAYRGKPMAQSKGYTPFLDIQIPVTELFGFWG